MHVGITGGTGFVGTHLSTQLKEHGHSVSLLARGRSDVDPALGSSIVYGAVNDPGAVEQLVTDCDCIVHLAGINYERGTQTYQAVHVDGTQRVVEAAIDEGVEHIITLSYLRARPGTGSGYLDSKWISEELIRAAPMSSTIFKPPAIFGAGDQLLTHLARWVQTLPVLPGVGLRGRGLRPIAVEDVVNGIRSCLEEPESWPETVALLGPESLLLRELGRRIATVLGRRPVTVPTPVPALTLGAYIQRLMLDPPIITPAGVRMISEGMTRPEPADIVDEPPTDWTAAIAPTTEVIESILDSPTRYGISDLQRPW